MNVQYLWIPFSRRSRRRCFSVAALALTAVLTSCAVPTTAVESASGGGDDVGDRSNLLEGDHAENGQPSERSEKRSSEPSSRRLCDRPEVSLSPLSTPEDTPVFEQFNFQPQNVAISASEVTIDTTYHTFSYCQNTGEWAIANRAPSQASSFNYEQYILELADPSYETIELDGLSYEYRVRLQADWIEKQIDEQGSGEAPSGVTADDATIDNTIANDETSTSDEKLESSAESASEEAVYLDIKSPNGRITTRQLYTLSDVRNASIGASLGVPSVAQAIAHNGTLWFAATTSQGEGENGFASLVQYDPKRRELEVHQPAGIQGDQITTLVATPALQEESGAGDAGDRGNLTLWMGTLRSAEGTPFFPASGLVAYQPHSASDGTLRQFTINNSPMVGAIPYQLAAAGDDLWVATGNGVCQTQWQSIEQESSWRCWEFTATAALPADGVDLYPSFLAEDSTTTLKGSRVEVLWANWEHFDQPDVDRAKAFRYEVAYAPGFEADLAQGGYRVDNRVAQQMARGNDIFWPGQHWHWSGERFERSLDEVSLNLLGGGPSGLMASNILTGRSFDHYAVRGDFDLLSLEPNGTRVRYYSGWVEGKDLDVYPDIVDVESPKAVKPNPIVSIAADLPPVGP